MSWMSFYIRWIHFAELDRGAMTLRGLRDVYEQNVTFWADRGIA